MRDLLLCFTLVFAVACRDSSRTGIEILWENGKARKASIPAKLITGFNADSAAIFLQARLSDDTMNIIGHYEISPDRIVFEPLLAFTPGNSYDFFYKGARFGRLAVPAAITNDTPRVTAIYPVQDTVPENLLKIYVQFSHPMREGSSEKYIRLLKNGTDTVKDVFLNLQPELWNEDRTVITVWLDPGRIKRDLQPNLKLGAPLHATEKYRLLVSEAWKDARGFSLLTDGVKNFVTGPRDSLSPDLERWVITAPLRDSKDPLTILLPEPLDHFLLPESLHLTGSNGQLLRGNWTSSTKDTECRFFPADPWVSGEYQLSADAKLEDLAGNDLDRPFDRDVTQTKTQTGKKSYTKKIVIN